MAKGKDIVEKGPGDYKDTPKVPSWRGDAGDSSAKGSEETKDVEYKR